MAGGAALALFAGCLGSDGAGGDGTPPDAPRERSPPTDAPSASATGTETHTFPPPAPTSAAPTDPAPLRVESDWPRFQFDARNAGRDPGTTAVPDEATTRWQFYTRSTPPVVAGGDLYTAEFARDRYLVERDAATGRQRWTAPLSGGASGPPVVAGDRVFVQTYSTAYAFDRSGRERWSHDIGRGDPGAPIADGDAVYLCNGSFERWSAEAFALDAADGSERWAVELDGDVRGSPALADGRLYVATDAGTLYALDASDGRERWTADLGAGADATPAVADGSVYVVAGETAHARRIDDGSERWTAAVGAVDDGAAPAVADGSVYLGTETGLSALRAADGRTRWTSERGGPLTTPAVDDEVAYVGESGYDSRDVLALDRSDGSVRWSVSTDRQAISDMVVAGVRGPPTPVEGGLYVTAADGLHALGPPSG